ncbi:MAG: hypothetical protein G01um101418_712 [Parcubacteria group bacterium Gr01-1014_18]|nr:MAG: hypothetical protein Greene041636_702 [Parcubacteria group bacterium Greene0416_36]TSC80204.1 MAG: hypothetical protein G01um101418_712 [Parcubacteria group bacterium Gr01-1014_18]TSC98386.1 MAG: hypothetical protein Greene101420_739 [Parcubacteria group bacterium Greene1014_20]TSD06927.1 MAG: hypothetical protein Greene07142_490 [Parcubacteria group bacterium Greene0714_2]
MQQVDQAFVEMVVKAIVANPQDVTTVRSVDEMGVLITLKINPADMGYVIGRQGQTARAIRTLLRIVGAKHNARVNLKIEEPAGSKRSLENAAAAAAAAAGASSDEIGSDDIADLKI